MPRGESLGRFGKALWKGAGDVSRDDVDDVAGRGEEIDRKLARNRDSFGDRLVHRIRLFESAVRDYSSGAYRDIPWTTIALVAFALLYFLNPADIFPDVIPISGFIDDAGIVALAFGSIMGDLSRYERWKNGRVEGEDTEE